MLCHTYNTMYILHTYHTIPYHTIAYHSIPYHIISYHIIPSHTISYHTIAYHSIPDHTIPYHIISYHTISYHTISYHIIPYHTIPYHTIPYIHRHLIYIDIYTHTTVGSSSASSGQRPSITTLNPGWFIGIPQGVFTSNNGFESKPSFCLLLCCNIR